MVRVYYVGYKSREKKFWLYNVLKWLLEHNTYIFIQQLQQLQVNLTQRLWLITHAWLKGHFTGLKWEQLWYDYK
jgi:hypothetical protein